MYDIMDDSTPQSALIMIPGSPPSQLAVKNCKEHEDGDRWSMWNHKCPNEREVYFCHDGHEVDFCQQVNKSTFAASSRGPEHFTSDYKLEPNNDLQLTLGKALPPKLNAWKTCDSSHCLDPGNFGGPSRFRVPPNNTQRTEGFPLPLRETILKNQQTGMYICNAIHSPADVTAKCSLYSARNLTLPLRDWPKKTTGTCEGSTFRKEERVPDLIPHSRLCCNNTWKCDVDTSFLLSMLLAFWTGFSELSVLGSALQDPDNCIGRTRNAFAKADDKLKLWNRTRSIFSLVNLLILLSSVTVLGAQANDLRDSINRGMEPCFLYVPERNLISLNCSVLHWRDHGYTADSYITLGANEIFDGSPTNGSETPNHAISYHKNSCGIIDLSGIIGFEGLIKIGADVAAFENAPVIRNVHVRNGKIAEKGGFIVQKEQSYFVVDSCSSSGEISNLWAGGIGGFRVGLKGNIQISNSFSTGKITGGQAGGIVGEQVGNNGYANIRRCYSTGNIESGNAGGICGWGTGMNGIVHITQCFSTGDILATHSGGIVGDVASMFRGYVRIQKCYSTGTISGYGSGGITGAELANSEGEVRILDCFTSGDIHGQWAGGITGMKTGGSPSRPNENYEFFGDVYIHNTYTSGILHNDDAGGIIGSIHPDFGSHMMRVQHSVYNNDDNSTARIVGNGDPGNHLKKKGISGNLESIRGQLYHYAGEQLWDNNNWVTNGTDNLLPTLSFQPEIRPFSQCTALNTAFALRSRKQLPVQLPGRSARQIKFKRQNRR